MCAALQDAILEFVNRAKKWNVDVFGNLFTKKKRLLARLHGTQKALANNPNEFLLELEQQLLSDYSLVLMQEEEYWALKSRLNTATFGDRNTSFFHVSTIVRRHRNKIRCLKVSEDTWLTEEVEIKSHIRDNYKNLYITELPMSPITSDVSGFSCCFLDERTRACLERGVTEDEIRASLWALKPFKAPGPDGLHAGFYQRFWVVVKRSICNEVKEIFDKGCVPSYLNETLSP